MINRGLKLSHGIYFGAGKDSDFDMKPNSVANSDQINLFLPTLSRPLLEDLYSLCDTIDFISTDDVNSNSILDCVGKAAGDGAQMVIYSGIGGQLVKPDLLDMGLPFIHAHSGLLPRFRGSTTIYYSMLERRDCAVSVIQLNRDIDQGPILLQQVYPLPPFGIDIDNVYDPAIRADLLVRFLCQSDSTEKLISSETVTHESEIPTDYYVIHPVLKHLAILLTADSPAH